VLAAVRGHRWVCAMPEGNLKILFFRHPVFRDSRISEKNAFGGFDCTQMGVHS